MSLKTRKPVSSAPSEAALRADFNERILRSSHLDKISRKWEGVRVLAIADARLCGEKHLYILVPEFLATMQEHGALNGSLAIRLEVLKQHECRLWVFEAMPEYSARLARRLGRIPGVRIFPYGLAGTDQTAHLRVDEDASSVFETASARSVRISDS
jgi:hypothetical protein